MGIAIGVREARWRKDTSQPSNQVIIVIQAGKTAASTMALRVPHIHTADCAIAIAVGAPWTDAVDSIVERANCVRS